MCDAAPVSKAVHAIGVLAHYNGFPDSLAE